MSWLTSSLTDVASVLANQQSQRQAIAQTALARGAKLIQDRNFEGGHLRLQEQDATTHKATVYFTIRQNDTGDGIIAPSHWVIQFGGTDVNGNPMDPVGDEFDGCGRLPF